VTLFNKINKTDKSNLNNPEIRRNDFYNNFDTIIHLMNCSDFTIKYGNYAKKEKQKRLFFISAMKKSLIEKDVTFL